MIPKPLFRHMAALAALAQGAAPLEAAPDTDHEAAVGRCIRKSSSGRKWLEVTLWGLRDQEGGAVGTRSVNVDGSEDFGPMQINSWWTPHIVAITGNSPASVRYWLIHDICFNVDASRWIFLSALSAKRDYWSAVGAYHSPNPVRQQRYARQVFDKIRRRFGGSIFNQPVTRPDGTRVEYRR
jgi:hypothetical protein